MAGAAQLLGTIRVQPRAQREESRHGGIVSKNDAPDSQSVTPRNVARDDTAAPPPTSDDAVGSVCVGTPNDSSPTGGPARGYSWPAFQEGHTLSLVHGAESPRTIEARAAEVREQLFEVAPWLAQDVFVPAVARFLRCEAREMLIHEHIAKVSAEKGAGFVPQRLWESATACANASMKASALLGLDPQSYARLRATTGHAAATEHTLADLKDQGRQTTGYQVNAGPDENGKT
jgi:hypothetical protein